LKIIKNKKTLVRLTEKWHSNILGATFPIGTIFLKKKLHIWTYLCPNGSHGECCIKGEMPGE